MTAEAAENGCIGIEDPVAHSSRIPVARCSAIALQTGEPTLVMLQIVAGSEPAYKRDGALAPNAHSPGWPGRDGAKARAWALADCSEYTAAWHSRHAADPAYSLPAPAISNANAST